MLWVPRQFLMSTREKLGGRGEGSDSWDRVGAHVLLSMCLGDARCAAVVSGIRGRPCKGMLGHRG